MKKRHIMSPITNPLTGRKVRTECNTYKRVAQAICNNPELLYSACNIVDPQIFATNFVHIESNYYLSEPYDPTRTNVLFFPDGTWMHMHMRGVRGKIPILEPATSTLFTASALPESPNECYMSTLDTLDNWSELERWRILITEDGYMFDLFFILKSVINQLNEVKNGNAYPVYPTNPFTKQPFSTKFFKTMRRKLLDNGIKHAAVLTVFFRDPLPKEIPTDWIMQFEAAGLRYYKDWDGTGFWDLDNNPISRLIQQAFFGRELEFMLVVLQDRSPSYYWQGFPIDPAAAEMASRPRQAIATTPPEEYDDDEYEDEDYGYDWYGPLVEYAADP